MSAEVRWLGDAAVVVTLASELSAEANDRVLALAASLRDRPIDGVRVRDIVPALASLTVHFAGPVDDTVMADVRARGELFPVEFSRSLGPGKLNREELSVHEIPVAYGGAEGPDIGEVAAFARCAPEEVVARHTSRVYRVYMLGFLPGFAYLGDVDPAIAAPRRATPRQAVPAGSVGIAGAQTGVYPQVSPGGWQIIGRTDTRMFDPASGSRLQPGDRVRFVAMPAS